MIINLYAIIFLSAWTLLILFILLIGYFLDKSYRVSIIYPLQTNNQGQIDNTIQKNEKNIHQQKVSQKTQQVTKTERNALDEFFNTDHSPNINDVNFTSNDNRNEQQNQNQLLTPRTNKTFRRQQSMRRTILKKPTISMGFEGVEAISTIRSRTMLKITTPNSEKNSVIDSDQVSQQQIKVSQFIIYNSQNDSKIPKPKNDYYKLHMLSKIYFSHKNGISRIFMILCIYFRQIICFDACGILLLFLPNLNTLIIMGIIIGLAICFRIIGYYVIKAIVHNMKSIIFKYTQYGIWLISIGIIIWLLLLQINNNYWMMCFLPNLIVDLILVDPIKYLTIKHFLKEHQKTKETSKKVNVIQASQAIQ